MGMKRIESKLKKCKKLKKQLKKWKEAKAKGKQKKKEKKREKDDTRHEKKREDRSRMQKKLSDLMKERDDGIVELSKAKDRWEAVQEKMEPLSLQLQSNRKGDARNPKLREKLEKLKSEEKALKRKIQGL